MLVLCPKCDVTKKASLSCGMVPLVIRTVTTRLPRFQFVATVPLLLTKYALIALQTCTCSYSYFCIQYWWGKNPDACKISEESSSSISETDMND